MSILCARVKPLLKKLQNGNSSAFKELFNVTYRHLIWVAKEYAIDKNDAEDIVQEAYIRVSRYIHTFDLKQDGYNWLCKIVQNAAYDFYKIAPPIVIQADVSYDTLEDSLAEKNAVHMELAKLPKEDRDIMYLRFWEDKTIRDIAKIVGLSKSVVHKRIEDIKKKFEKYLK